MRLVPSGAARESPPFVCLTLNQRWNQPQISRAFSASGLLQKLRQAILATVSWVRGVLSVRNQTVRDRALAAGGSLEATFYPGAPVRERLPVLVSVREPAIEIVEFLSPHGVHPKNSSS